MSHPRCLHSNFCGNRGYHWKTLQWANLCRWQTYSSHYTWKAKQSVAQLLFLIGQGECYIGHFCLTTLSEETGNKIYRYRIN